MRPAEASPRFPRLRIVPGPPLPPQNREAERAVIGAILRDPADVLPAVRKSLTADAFYFDAHQRIYTALCDLADESQPIDLVLLYDKLRKNKQIDDVGGQTYLAELWTDVPTGANATHHAKLVRDAATLRGLIHATNEILRDAYDCVQSPDELLESAQKRIATVVSGRGDEHKQKRFEFVTSDAFASGDYRPQWHISRILTRGEPGTIAGPSKGLKTNIAVEAAVCMAAGVPFLGQFDVPHRTRVALVSGESGKCTLQETANRVCRAKGLSLADLKDHLAWCFSLPTFSDLGVMHEFARELAKLRAEVVFIDPVYLSLGAIDAKNLFEAGAAFRVVAEVLLKVGCTPILIHHANRQLQVGEPMELTHLAYSGLEQFARQFILINRRERYQGDGVHDLWFSVGGSAGHGGLWALHIEEGTVDENFAGREWNVTVQTRSEVQEDRVAQRDRDKREQTRRKHIKDEAAVLDAIDGFVEAGAEAATKTQIRNRTGHSTQKLDEVLEGLQEAGAIEAIEFKRAIGQGAKRSTTGYRRYTRDH